MADQVKVTSIDALETFRASLILFLTKARRSLDDTGDQVRRTRLWLQHDQRLHWENQTRKWRKVLDQAQQELLSARISSLRDTTTAQLTAVRKARQELELAESKLRKVKAWNRDYDSSAEPLTRKLTGLREYLDQDMPKAVTYLVQAQRTLDAYTEIPSPATVAINPDTQPSDEPNS